MSNPTPTSIEKQHHQLREGLDGPDPDEIERLLGSILENNLGKVFSTHCCGSSGAIVPLSVEFPQVVLLTEQGNQLEIEIWRIRDIGLVL